METVDDVGRPNRMALWPVAVVIAVGVVVTVVITVLTARAQDNRRDAQLDQAAADAQRVIEERVGQYTGVLGGLRSYFGTSDFVTREDFAAYVSGEDVSEHLPGTDALGFSPLVRASEVGAFERDVRSDTSVESEGYPEFTVHPSSDNDTVLPITYLDPLAGNEMILGFDLSGDEAGQFAVEVATDTGTVTAGAPSTSAADGKRPVPMFLALYDGGGVPGDEGARAERFEGLVLGVFDIDAAMQGVLGADPIVEVELYDAGITGAAGLVQPSSETLLYDSDDDLAAIEGGATGPNRELTVPVANRRWLLHVAPGPTFDDPSPWVPWMVALGGLLLTASLAGLVYLLGESGRRAAVMAQEMTSDLRDRERQLEQVAGDIVRSNRDLERYATIAAHDLQEPLRSILAYSDLLQRKYGDVLTGEVSDYVDRMSQAAQRMRTLVTDLLAYARLETAENRSARVQLDDVVRAAITDLDYLIEETGARIEIEDLPEVSGNDRELIGVFSNLLSNALKYRSPDRSPVVRVWAERAGDDWLIRVSDNGIGIAPDFHLRIFELFRRLGPRDDTSGTGLGLAICARTIAQHGGKIWVESEEGTGATFLFTLPVRRAAPVVRSVDEVQG